MHIICYRITPIVVSRMSSVVHSLVHHFSFPFSSSSPSTILCGHEFLPNYAEQCNERAKTKANAEKTYKYNCNGETARSAEEMARRESRDQGEKLCLVNFCSRSHSPWSSSGRCSSSKLRMNIICTCTEFIGFGHFVQWSIVQRSCRCTSIQLIGRAQRYVLPSGTANPVYKRNYKFLQFGALHSFFGVEHLINDLRLTERKKNTRSHLMQSQQCNWGHRLPASKFTERRILCFNTNTFLWHRTTCVRRIRHFRFLFSSFVSSIEMRIDSLPYCSVAYSLRRALSASKCLPCALCMGRFSGSIQLYVAWHRQCARTFEHCIFRCT